MEDRPLYEQFRDQFRAWTQHVMTAGSTGFHESYHQFYGGFTWEHEAVVWGFIEENYLRKYGGFLRVDFDWMADGLWEIPFPGSVYMGISVEPENFGMPGPLAARVRAWQASLDRLDVSEKDPDPGQPTPKAWRSPSRSSCFWGTITTSNTGPFGRSRS